MRIQCDKCGASGNFDESRLPPGGANITCPRCKEKFWVSPEGAAAPAVESTAPAQPSIESTVSPDSSTDTERRAACVMCRRPSAVSEMVQIQGKWVCGDCKPDYVRTLKMGLTQPGDYRYAGFWIRFAAKFLDGLITGAATFILLIPLQLVFAADPQMMQRGEVGIFFFAFALQMLIQLGIPAAYGTFFLGKFQATPGKMACGLKVVRPDGEELTYMRALGRYFSEIISYIIFTIGYIMAAFDSEKRALHDRICDTRVVYK